jgi:hypothetical protein
VTLVLETLRRDKTLDLGSLGVRLCALLLGLHFATDNEFTDLDRDGTSDSTLCKQKDWRRSYEITHIIFLAETEETAELGSPLGTQPLWVNRVGDAGDIVIALADDAEGEDREVHADDAAADALPLALSSTTRSVAGVTLGEEEFDTGRMHNALLHRKALLVVAAGDLEDVAFELVADAVTGNLLAHTAVHEDAQLAVVINLDELLRAILGIRNVQLHDGGGAERGVSSAACEFRFEIVGR